MLAPVVALALALALAPAAAAQPNTSFATLPVFYYGADVGAARTDANVAMLAKMRLVALLQQVAIHSQSAAPPLSI